MDLRLHYTPTPGYTQLVTPGEQPLQHLNFGMLRLAADELYSMATGNDEAGFAILAGSVTARIAGDAYSDLGERDSVFDGHATGIYVPQQSEITLTGGPKGAEIAVSRCQATARFPVQIIRPAQVVAREVGADGYRRYVHEILGVTNSQAERLILGETFTIAGNWSSFPPHKHDTPALPDEVAQEELYIYKIRPEQGFGIQYWYTTPDSPFGPLDEIAAVRENDITLMPYGYHPVAAPPGYDVYYLWFMAGAVREMHPNEDPAHRWLKTEPWANRDLPR
jgi:5-deoxy-glucuronate isomerase